MIYQVCKVISICKDIALLKTKLSYIDILREEKDDDIPLLTPEMVRAEFPIINEIEKDREDFR